MRKYFRTLYLLKLYFKESKSFYPGYSNSDGLHSVMEVLRQILKKQLSQPFQKIHTVEIVSTDAFHKRVFEPYKDADPKTILNEWLEKYELSVTSIDRVDGIVTGFSYTYI